MPPNHHLTKTAFKAAYDCPTKLYYYLSRYPSTVDEDEYIELLSNAGFVVGKLAQLQYREGISISRDNGIEEALADTKAALAQPAVTLFEAGLVSGGKLVFIDILRRENDSLELIEVKSRSLDGRKDGYGLY